MSVVSACSCRSPLVFVPILRLGERNPFIRELSEPPPPSSRSTFQLPALDHALSRIPGKSPRRFHYSNPPSDLSPVRLPRGASPRGRHAFIRMHQKDDQGGFIGAR
ncbi:hypothetical protein CgunFtcFv8_006006 [Champsocephalus gunnari]|uniref:Uncharacterized protein n=1 Tax=Champsocephalus gunnari TaxID=52237 RepID=A0AAN8BXA3_CHAGU|nr:hypothetical protein CgunFtcFv8_006006 [Champsocephalus gunnari]